MTKTIFVCLMVWLGILNVNAASNPYKETSSYGLNCTWYAWKMAYEKANVTLPSWGNAKDWYKDAKNDGYSVGSNPKSNAIIVWENWTNYGHVGYVEKVEGNILSVWDSTGPCIDEHDPTYIECMANSVCEETDKACKQTAKRIACEYDISNSDYKIRGYIYLDNAPKKISSSNSSNNTKKEETIIKNETKSNNSYLSNIEISNGSIEFNKEIYEYSIEVENEVDMFIINATTEDKKATINGVGEYKLNIGANEIQLTVTAEDKSKKEYTINITRKEKIQENKIKEVNKEETKLDSAKKTNFLVLGIISVIIICSLCYTFIKKNKKG